MIKTKRYSDTISTIFRIIYSYHDEESNSTTEIVMMRYDNSLKTMMMMGKLIVKVNNDKDYNSYRININKVRLINTSSFGLS